MYNERQRVDKTRRAEQNYERTPAAVVMRMSSSPGEPAMILFHFPIKQEGGERVAEEVLQLNRVYLLSYEKIYRSMSNKTKRTSQKEI